MVDSKDSDESSEIVENDSKRSTEAEPKAGANPLNKYFSGATVSARDFYSKPEYPGEGYYFQTPSNVHSCLLTKKYVGCLSNNPPADGPKVDYPDGDHRKANAVHLAYGSKAKMIGLTEAAYVTFDGPTKVLDYGDILNVNGFQCTTNMQDGVICKQGSHGFQFSSKTHLVR